MRPSSLWRLMLASLAVGVLMLFGGAATGTEIGALAAGYGSLIIGAALFLGFGLAIETRVGRSVARARSQAPAPSSSVQGHRVF